MLNKYLKIIAEETMDTSEDKRPISLVEDLISMFKIRRALTSATKSVVLYNLRRVTDWLCDIASKSHDWLYDNCCANALHAHGISRCPEEGKLLCGEVPVLIGIGDHSQDPVYGKCMLWLLCNCGDIQVEALIRITGTGWKINIYPTRCDLVPLISPPCAKEFILIGILPLIRFRLNCTLWVGSLSQNIYV